MFTSSAEGVLRRTAREEEGPVPETRARTRLCKGAGLQAIITSLTSLSLVQREKNRNKLSFSVSSITQEVIGQKKNYLKRISVV